MGLFVESLAVQFSKTFLHDPVMKALWDGSMLWGDIPGILDMKSECQKALDSPLSIESPVKATAFTASSGPTVAEGYEVCGIKTIIVRNLPRDITTEKLRAIFEKYGPVRDIYIPKNMDKSSPYFGTIKGFSLIKFLKAEDSARAYHTEYGCLTIGKNNITVEFAKEDR
jgi:hypothetical protein